MQHTISFRNAFKGIWTAVTTQNNLRVHFFVGSLVLFGAAYLRLSIQHVLVLVLAISQVMVAEMVNTALELLSNAVTLEHNNFIKYAKDVSAGAVLLSAIFATLIGFMIFIPAVL